MGDPWETKTTGSGAGALSGISNLGRELLLPKMASPVFFGK